VDVGSESLEIIELGTDMGIDAHTVSIGIEDAGLKSAEKATTARDSQHHAAEFAHQHLLPGFEGDAFAPPKVIKDGTQTLVLAVRRQLQSLLNGIDEPSKDHFRSRAPAIWTHI
jgi:hypothetical protein